MTIPLYHYPVSATSRANRSPTVTTRSWDCLDWWNRSIWQPEMEVDKDPEVTFDLEAYITPYTGHAKINRLIFIARKSL